MLPYSAGTRERPVLALSRRALNAVVALQLTGGEARNRDSQEEQSRSSLLIFVNVVKHDAGCFIVELNSSRTGPPVDRPAGVIVLKHAILCLTVVV
jgi:hypothetical protein